MEVEHHEIPSQDAVEILNTKSPQIKTRRKREFGSFVKASKSPQIKTSQDAVEILNTKYDLTKREFGSFVKAFQGRLGTFEEAVGKSLVQAKLEFQLEGAKTEEGYLAATKLLHLLQKELGDFMDSNGRHVGFFWISRLC